MTLTYEAVNEKLVVELGPHANEFKRNQLPSANLIPRGELVLKQRKVHKLRSSPASSATDAEGRWLTSIRLLNC